MNTGITSNTRSCDWLWPLLKHHSLMMLLGLLLSLIALLSGMGLLSLSGWFLSATALAGLTVTTAQAFNYFTPAGGVRGLSIARTASRYGERLVTHEATFRALTTLRSLAWRALLPLGEQRLGGERRGELLNRLVADIDTLDHLYLRLAVPLCSFVLGSLLLVGFVAWFDPAKALLLGGGLLLSALCLPALFYVLGRRASRGQVQGKRDYRIALLEYLSAQGELTLFGAREGYRAALDERERTWQRTQAWLASLNGIGLGLTIFIHGTLVLLILLLVSGGVGSNQPPGALAALLLFAALSTMELLSPLSTAFAQLAGTLEAANRVDDLLTAPPGVQFVSQGPTVTEGRIELKGIDFAYPGGAPVLKGVALELAPGSSTALIGKTGCGKSTLLSLLTRCWEPVRGEILLDGRPLTAYSEAELRRAITVVSQRVHVFSASLRDNLLLANEAATDAELTAVLAKVGLGHLALDCWLGDGGRPLSGGETRRLGIARALLRDSPILLLDEPTEGLDRHTEAQMLRLLLAHCRGEAGESAGAEGAAVGETKALAKGERKQGRTLLMISHRLTAMAQMDQICVLEQGQIVARGDHAQLLADFAPYARQYRR
ncbi:heme ABC transporter ATP-binding protein/permease CydC [Shewanella sedimentimangrovi]|uniref:Cysteine/glutathione ABC transporter ATP-binding protein/permease CydC n=1 Tax=Shewanella sedimentimangrovi TaxID=2814293 RepID=A0ABX7R6U3_9GAMM|nr:cysteine/glutathione ABC transporter ATP-binding protein/permease CydC [Shewanella sedimentimangrovi]